MQINLENILFLDIETVPQNESFDQLSDEFKALFDSKSRYQRADNVDVADFYEERAGIWAEFGKIVCISVGFISVDPTAGTRSFRSKSFYGDDEKKILVDFKELLDRKYAKIDSYLCAHNGKEFDYPFIARRMLINGIKLPAALDISGKKPWEIRHLDTMELWKFGDYKHYSSVKLLTAIFDIPSPKDDIDGSEVARVYFKEKNLKRIAVYCEKDTFAVAQIYLKINGMETIDQENFYSVQ